MPLNKSYFVSTFESMKADTIIIGSSLIPSEGEVADTFDKQGSFQGQINNFFIYPFEIATEDIHKTSRFSNANRKLLPKQTIVKLIKSALDKDKKSDFDPNHLIENSILNLNAFVKMTRLNIHQEIAWNINPQIYQSAQKKTFSFFGGKIT